MGVLSEKERFWLDGKFAGVFVGDDDTVHALFEYEEPDYVIERMGRVSEARLRFAQRITADKITLLPKSSANPDETQAEHEAGIARGIVKAAAQLRKVERALASIDAMKQRLASSPTATLRPERQVHPFTVINGDRAPG